MLTQSRRKARASTSAIKLAELSFAAPQVIAHRLTRMALAGPTLSARDRKEFSGMVTEKQAAVAQAWMGMFAESVRFQQQFALSLLTAATPLQHAAWTRSAASRIASAGLAPIHRKAVANAKRLARTKLR
ncbi:MAG: hypothetical protein JO090_04305 [Rhizobacter sp.]|nr:hypothetical protein [Rhizobacter sp.]